MGKISNSINHYLSDNRRFADLFNEICFHGETVVRAEDLSDGTQVYYGAVQESERNGQSKKAKGHKERIRDICKRLKTARIEQGESSKDYQIDVWTVNTICPL